METFDIMEKVNINTASFDDLKKIIHIGPVRAADIIDFRSYGDIYELSAILGLGPRRMKDIIDQNIATV